MVGRCYHIQSSISSNWWQSSPGNRLQMRKLENGKKMIKLKDSEWELQMHFAIRVCRFSFRFRPLLSVFHLSTTSYRFWLSPMPIENPIRISWQLNFSRLSTEFSFPLHCWCNLADRYRFEGTDAPNWIRVFYFLFPFFHLVFFIFVFFVLPFSFMLHKHGTQVFVLSLPGRFVTAQKCHTDSEHIGQGQTQINRGKNGPNKLE